MVWDIHNGTINRDNHNDDLIIIIIMHEMDDHGVGRDCYLDIGPAGSSEKL